MALQTPPYALQASSHSAELFRRATLSEYTGTGVLGSPDLLVTQDTGSDMKVAVAAGQIVVPGTLGSTTGMFGNTNGQTPFSSPGVMTSQGNYYGYNDASVLLTISTSNPSNPRIDLIVATVQDAQYSGASNTAVLQVVTGTPAASPVAPTPPANSYVLASVAVGAGVTSIVNANITDQRIRASRFSWQQAWGLQAFANLANTFSQASASTTMLDIIGMTTTFTGIANRRYQAHFHMPECIRASGTALILGINAGGTLIQTAIIDSALAGSVGQFASFWSSVFTASGSTIVKGQFKNTNGISCQVQADSSTSSSAPFIAVYDVGPATAA